MHFTGLNLKVGPSELLGEERISSWTPPFLYIHYITGTNHTGTWFFLMTCSSTSHFNQMIQWYLHRSQAAWRTSQKNVQIKEHHWYSSTWQRLSFSSSQPSVQFTIQLGSSMIIPSRSARNLGVIPDDQLTFKDHIANTIMQVCTKH